jgi:ribosome-associated protein
LRSIFTSTACIEREQEAIINTKERVNEVKVALEDKLAKDVTVWHVAEVSSVTDYYIVASGTSGPHLKALLTGLQQHMKAKGEVAARTSGMADSGWVIIDFVDVVVHIFAPEEREYYNIEDLWVGAKVAE